MSNKSNATVVTWASISARTRSTSSALGQRMGHDDGNHRNRLPDAVGVATIRAESPSRLAAHFNEPILADRGCTTIGIRDVVYNRSFDAAISQMESSQQPRRP